MEGRVACCGYGRSEFVDDFIYVRAKLDFLAEGFVTFCKVVWVGPGVKLCYQVLCSIINKGFPIIYFCIVAFPNVMCGVTLNIH
jgi:hypothetical protein